MVSLELDNPVLGQGASPTIIPVVFTLGISMYGNTLVFSKLWLVHPNDRLICFSSKGFKKYL